MSRPLSVAISMSSAHAVLTTMSIVGIWGVYAPTCRVGASSSAEPRRILPSLSASRLATFWSIAISPPGDAVPRLLEVGDVGLGEVAVAAGVDGGDGQHPVLEADLAEADALGVRDALELLDLLEQVVVDRLVPLHEDVGAPEPAVALAGRVDGVRRGRRPGPRSGRSSPASCSACRSGSPRPASGPAPRGPVAGARAEQQGQRSRGCQSPLPVVRACAEPRQAASRTRLGNREPRDHAAHHEQDGAGDHRGPYAVSKRAGSR